MKEKKSNFNYTTRNEADSKNSGLKGTEFPIGNSVPEPTRVNTDRRTGFFKMLKKRLSPVRKISALGSFSVMKKRAVDPNTISTVRAQLVAFMAEHPLKAVQPDAERAAGLWPNLSWLRPMTAVLTMVLLVFGGASAYAGTLDTLPGDTFYPVKLFYEDVRLILTLDEDKRIELRNGLVEKRARELSESLRALERTDETDRKKGKRLDDLSDVLEDIGKQAGKLEEARLDSGQSGRGSDFLKQSERLRANAAILENILENDDLAQSPLNSEAGETRRQLGELKTSIEAELGQPAGAAETAASALSAAEQSIAAAEARLAGLVSGSRYREDALKAITDAKSRLGEARTEYDNGDWDNAYDKALRAVREATEAMQAIETATAIPFTPALDGAVNGVLPDDNRNEDNRDDRSNSEDSGNKDPLDSRNELPVTEDGSDDRSGDGGDSNQESDNGDGSNSGRDGRG